MGETTDLNPAAPAQPKRPQRWGKILAGLILLASAVATVWLGSVTKRLAAGNAGLVVADRFLNLGEVWEDPALAWTITVTNSSEETVHVEDFVTTCNCVSVEPKSLVLPPGEAANVRVTFNFTLTPSRRHPITDEEDVEVGVAPVIRNGWAQERGWTFRARVRRLLRVNPRLLDLGTDLVKGGPILPRKVVVTSKITLAKLLAHCDPAVGDVQVTPVPGQSNSFSVAVTPSARLPGGNFRFDVMLKAVQPGGASLPPVKLPVTGVVQSEVQALPAALAFGVQPVGSQIREVVVLSSLRNRAFDIESIQTTSESTRVEAFEEAKSGRAFRIVQTIAAPGKHQHTVTFSVRTADKQVATARLRLTYIGVEPEK